MSYDNLFLEFAPYPPQPSTHLKNLEQVKMVLQIKEPIYVYLLSDDELLDVNTNVLNHDYYTDIITFDYRDDDDLGYAELLISYDRIVDNAETHKSSNKQELNRVIIHGMLHLCGFNDSTEKEKKIIRDKENYYLNTYCST
jgi:probable rRNA maturation factor